MTREQALKNAEDCLRWVSSMTAYNVSEASGQLAIAKAKAAEGYIQLAKELDR